MKKKFQFTKNIDILFLLIILFLTIIDFVTNYKEIYNLFLTIFNINKIQNFYMLYFVLYNIIALVIMIIFSLLKHFYLIIAYIAYKIAQRKHIKEKEVKISKDDTKYYRDIISKYSPAVLSYIFDFNVGKNELIATLLMLELKGKIKIEEKITILNSDYKDLEQNEIYVLNAVKNCKLKKFDFDEYKKVVCEDSLNNNLLKKKGNRSKYITVFFLITIVITIILFYYSFIKMMIISNSNSIEIVDFILPIVAMVIVSMCPVFLLAYVFFYHKFQVNDPYIRNSEGKSLYIKLNGLKNFLTDFSNIKNKSKEELILWEDYLIYSVLFDLNTKLTDDINSKI